MQSRVVGTMLSGVNDPEPNLESFPEHEALIKEELVFNQAKLAVLLQYRDFLLNKYKNVAKEIDALDAMEVD